MTNLHNYKLMLRRQTVKSYSGWNAAHIYGSSKQIATTSMSSIGTEFGTLAYILSGEILHVCIANFEHESAFLTLLEVPHRLRRGTPYGISSKTLRKTATVLDYCAKRKAHYSWNPGHCS